MNNKKMIIALSAFMLLSHEMRASARNFIIGTLIVAYIHENVMTSQDLTKLPGVTSKDFQEYNDKLMATASNTYTSLQKISATLQAYFATKSPEVVKSDDTQKPLSPVVHNDPARDQIEKRHD